MMPVPDLGADLIAGLRWIMPPAALVHVGAGRGTGAMHAWRNWDVPAAWLVDAEPAQLAWAERLAATHPGWQVCPALLAESDGRAQYYRASNPAESGLIPTSKLAALWPNLREGEHGERPGTRLDTLLAGTTELPGGAGWWLIVDCLPALRVLQGAPETLERCSVLWLRALLQPLPEPEPGATLDELQAFLAPLGFRCVQITESNHPALGETVFVRDWAQRLQPVIAELHARDAQYQQQNWQLSARLAEQEAASQAAALERDTQVKLAGERQARIDALAKDKAELATRLAQLDKDHAAAAEALKAAHAHLAARTGERDALAKDKAELSDRLAVEAKRHTELAGKLSQLEKDHATATGDRDAQARLAGERQSQLDALDKEKADLSGRLANEAKRYTELSSKFTQLEKDHAAAAAALKAAQADLAARTSERDAQAKLAGERQVRLDALTKEKSELAAKLDNQAKVHAELVAKTTAVEAERKAQDEALEAANADLAKRTAERDAQSKLAAERQAQRDALDKEKATLADKLAAAETAKQDLSKRSDALQGQLDGLTTQRDKLSKENASLGADLQVKDAAIASLNTRIAEQDERERQLVEEIVRAEAQIDLIKDLLLREGGL